MVDDKTGSITVNFPPSRPLLVELLEEGGRLFAVVRENYEGHALLDPVRVELDKSRLEELEGATAGSPKFEYRGVIALPR
jgi:hypothetical protein